MACGRGCSFGWDVRCCCEPNCLKKNTTKQFNNCPKKLDTIYFHLLNEYEIYTKIELIDELDIKTVKQLVKMLHRGIKLTDEECIDLICMINDELESDDYGIGDVI